MSSGCLHASSPRQRSPVAIDKPIYYLHPTHSGIRSHVHHKEGFTMGFDQYHEPPEELSAEVRTFARMILSLIEEAQAIDWYEQRMAVEKDKDAKAIMENAQKEEFKHFGMDLEFLLRKKPKWRETLKGILFQKGDIVELGEKAEGAVD
jgi:hypothetical protein